MATAAHPKAPAPGWPPTRVSGVVLTQVQALRLGIDIFGHLLED